MHELAHEFTSRKISPWGGIKFFHKTYMQTGLRSYLETVDLPEPGSNRSHNMIDIIEGFMVGAVLGSRRMEHTGMLRQDEVIREIFDWKRPMCSASTFGRFFRKFDDERNTQVFNKVMRFWFDQIRMRKMTIDIDSTVITRYGKQERARRGYNPGKRGHASHYPILAFCDELKMVIHSRLRSGDSHDLTGADGFIKEVFEIVDRDRVGLLRGDSGFYSDKLMRQLEDNEVPVSYILRAKMTNKLLANIAEVSDWYASDAVMPDTAYSELTYQARRWEAPRRFIVTRRPLAKMQSPQRFLFKADADFAKYEYKAYVTNTTLSAEKTHQLYNQRATCENHIKELKYDYAIDGFAMQSFSATEAAFKLIMLAYNIMSLFRQKILSSSVAHRLSTVKFQCIAIGSYVVTSGRKRKLKLSAEGRRRHFLEHIFSNMEILSPPYSFPNA